MNMAKKRKIVFILNPISGTHSKKEIPDLIDQTLDHEVTVTEVKDMVDEAIYYADKRSLGHVVDVLFRKRFDEEDMIILREKDFLH